jgi:hypothetical protein
LTTGTVFLFHAQRGTTNIKSSCCFSLTPLHAPQSSQLSVKVTPLLYRVWRGQETSSVLTNTDSTVAAAGKQSLILVSSFTGPAVLP